jgi:lysophospholipase L1-like esterase
VEKKNDTRRGFLKQMIVAGAATSLPSVMQERSSLADGRVPTASGYTFLFQGDSITDGNRTRNNDWNHVMGHGYQYIIASKLWYEFAGKGLHFFNRGISGNKITDLAARWEKDTIELKPDLVSILIGINDTSAFVSGNKDYTVEKYESGYRDLLKQTRASLPAIQLVLCEPFILPVGDKVKQSWEIYNQEVKNRQQVVKKLAGEYQAIFIPFQDEFNKALAKAPAEFWIWDGIHPMPAGHELMARAWLKQVSKRLNFI